MQQNRSLWLTLCRSGSRSFSSMEDFWGNTAQHSGVEKVRQMPLSRTYLLVNINKDNCTS